MKFICFFNCGHSGDILFSIPFIKDICEQLNIPCFYHHRCHPKISQNLPTKLTQISPPNYDSKFIDTEKIFFVNTWLHPYSQDKNFVGVNIESLYYLYNNICDTLNQKFNTNINLKSRESYFPSLDFDHLKRDNVDKFIKSDTNKKVLFCNGLCLSGQTCYNDDLSELIERLSKKYRDITFIATKKFDTKINNIVFTDDINQIVGCDLNEIGYLSTFCDLIIGRNSGPFAYSFLKENFNNQNKIIYGFGRDVTDCFNYDIKMKSKFIFDNSENKDIIDHSIEKTIEQYLL